MSTAHAVAVAVMFTWLGMVLAISFIEAPLKFRAPGVSLQIGLGIGRLVFRALNAVEAVLAVVLLIAVGYRPPSTTAVIAVGVVVVALAAQLVVVRPRLARRSDLVLSGPAAATSEGQDRRSRAHYGYVALESVKVVGLIIGGIALLAA
ncbi:hypothetical protein [Mycobacterium sp. 3519A]|jgi:hypothetical protein|uniref:hypothetical protein n=1 Tax=Mycobacterium sp. 3519A TaxID=2057184 RepID=UPI000C7E11F9|nr:hypothetical protein [Mycobacterium sp. 3519A]